MHDTIRGSYQAREALESIKRRLNRMLQLEKGILDLTTARLISITNERLYLSDNRIHDQVRYFLSSVRNKRLRNIE